MTKGIRLPETSVEDPLQNRINKSLFHVNYRWIC